MCIHKIASCMSVSSSIGISLGEHSHQRIVGYILALRYSIVVMVMGHCVPHQGQYDNSESQRVQRPIRRRENGGQHAGDKGRN